jgi:hypothetical protein
MRLALAALDEGYFVLLRHAVFNGGAAKKDPVEAKFFMGSGSPGNEEPGASARMCS